MKSINGYVIKWGYAKQCPSLSLMTPPWNAGVVGIGKTAAEAFRAARIDACGQGIDSSDWIPFVPPTLDAPADGEQIVFAAWLHVV